MAERYLAEIERTLVDPSILRNDLSEAAGIVSKHFIKKYLDPVNKGYLEKKADCMKKPSPHVALLQACKPFIKDRSMLDKLIDCFTSYDAASIMFNEFREGRENIIINDTDRAEKADSDTNVNNNADKILLLVALMYLNKMK